MSGLQKGRWVVRVRVQRGCGRTHSGWKQLASNQVWSGKRGRSRVFWSCPQVCGSKQPHRGWSGCHRPILKGWRGTERDGQHCEQLWRRYPALKRNGVWDRWAERSRDGDTGRLRQTRIDQIDHVRCICSHIEYFIRGLLYFRIKRSDVEESECSDNGGETGKMMLQELMMNSTNIIRTTRMVYESFVYMTKHFLGPASSQQHVQQQHGFWVLQQQHMQHCAQHQPINQMR